MSKLLPLFREAELDGPLNSETPVQRDPAGCSRCARGSQRNVHIASRRLRVGNKHAATDALPLVLAVLPHPTQDEQRSGAGWSSVASQKILGMLTSSWDARIVATYAARCAPVESKPEHKGLPDAVTACRGHLAFDATESKPDVVLCFGSDAVLSVQGFAPVANAPMGGHGTVRIGDRLVPVFHLPDPSALLASSVTRALVLKHLRRLADSAMRPVDELRAAFYPGPLGYTLVEDDESARGAFEVLSRAQFVSFDTETGGRPFNPEFYCARVAVTGLTFWAVRPQFHTFVWTGEVLQRVPSARALLRSILTGAVPKVAQNARFDASVIWFAFGWDVRPLESDTMIVARALDGDASAKLEAIAPTVGVPGHKAEAQQALSVAMRSLVKASKAATLPPAPPGVSEHYWRNAVAGVQWGDETKTWAYPLIESEVLSRYCARDALATALLHYAHRLVPDHELTAVREVDLPATRALIRVERRGFPVSRRAVEVFTVTIEAELNVVTAELTKYAPREDFNWSSPAQVATLLYDDLGLVVPKNVRLDSPRSTSEEALTALRSQSPVCDTLLRHRGLVKLDGTYATGLLQHVRADGRVHASFNVALARTGRISSSQPNLQNVKAPAGDEAGKTPWGKLARDCFAAMLDHEVDSLRGERRRVLIVRDQSQLELRVAAWLSGDDVMAELFRSGEDFHAATAKLVWGTLPGSVDTKLARKKAKIVNFGLLYGKGDGSLARELGVSMREAGEIRAAILGRFRKLDAWLRGQIVSVAREGFVNTFVPGACLDASGMRTRVAARRRWLHDSGSPDEYRRAGAGRAAQNTPIQGSAADLVTAALYSIVREYKARGLAAHVVCTVHDNMVVESELWCAEEADDILRAAMVRADLGSVPLVTDLEVGTHWGTMTPCPDAKTFLDYLSTEATR